MKSKKIIINGIDVSKCSSIDIDCGVVYCSEYGRNVYCESNNNCYYKQLQRKTAECEKLKSQLETYSNMLDSSEFKVALTDVRTGEREVWRKLGSKAQRYEQALNEIKDIIKPISDKSSLDNCWTLLNQCDNCAVNKECDIQSPYYVAKIVLFIIDRVKENNSG